MAKKSVKSNQSKNKRPAQKGRETASNRQLAALITFACSVLLFCLAVIPAEGLWGALRTFIFGIFGFCAFIFPLLLLIASVLIALDKKDKNYVIKLIESVLIITVICRIVHIFTFEPDKTFFAAVKDAYDVYKIDGSMFGSGVWGAVFGGLVLLITGGSKVAALVIEFILLFVLIMVATGLTLVNLFKGIAKPVKKIGEITGEKISEYG